MEKQTYKNKAGTVYYQPVVTESEFRDMRNEMMGFCLGCGAEVDSCEPDTRKRPCDECHQSLVYGLEELLIMDLVVLT